MTAQGQHVDTPRAVMWTVTAIAAHHGISKQAVSAMVGRLVESGLAVERDGRGRVRLVNAAQFDHLRSRFGHSAQQRSETLKPSEGDAESYDEALRVRAWTDAERRRIELDEMKTNLVRRDRIEDAVNAITAALEKVVDRLPDQAEDLVRAVTSVGLHGLRKALKSLAIRMRTEMADALLEMAEVAPKEDSLVPESATNNPEPP